MEVLHSGTYIADYEAGVAMTCHQVLPEKRLVVGGLANGSIAVWRSRTASTVGRVETKPQMLHGHSGIIRGLLLVSSPGIGGQDGYLIFSWSADRTVRVWDPESMEADKACVQTLRAHGGTVTDLVYTNGYLVTSSTDKTVRVWRAEVGRELLLYPWYNTVQTLADTGCWVNALAMQLMSESGALYVGDEQGTLSVYRASITHQAGLVLHKWRRQPHAHALGITRLVFIQTQHKVASASYDCTVKLFDTLSGSMLLSIENSWKVRYTSLLWDEEKSELLLADELGYLYFWNIGSERCLKMEKLLGPDAVRKVGGAKVAAALAAAAKAKPATDTMMASALGLGAPGAATGASGAAPKGLRQIERSGDKLYTSSGTAVDSWLVLRDVKYSESLGHTGPIVAVVVAEPQVTPRRTHGADARPVEEVAAAEQALVYSASLDGTLRAWDVYEMGCLSVLEERRSEISCLHHSPLCDMLLTGHDDGSIRIWNVDSGSTVTLSGHDNTVMCLGVAKRGAGQVLLSSGFDGQVGVWDITKQRNALPRLEQLLEASAEEVLALLVDPHAPQYVTAGNDALVRRRALTCTRYSLSSRPLYKNQYYYELTPPLFGHPTPSLLRPHYCAILYFLPTVLCCNTCHTIMVMAISCKGQAALPAASPRKGGPHLAVGPADLHTE